MKEFIKNLLDRLEEVKAQRIRLIQRPDRDFLRYSYELHFLEEIKEIVNELAEEYNNTSTEHINCSTDDVAQTERNKIIERLERFCDAECNGICYECEVPSAIRLLKEGE